MKNPSLNESSRAAEKAYKEGKKDAISAIIASRVRHRADNDYRSEDEDLNRKLKLRKLRDDLSKEKVKRLENVVNAADKSEELIDVDIHDDLGHTKSITADFERDGHMSLHVIKGESQLLDKDREGRQKSTGYGENNKFIKDATGKDLVDVVDKNYDRLKRKYNIKEEVLEESFTPTGLKGFEKKVKDGVEIKFMDASKEVGHAKLCDDYYGDKLSFLHDLEVKKEFRGKGYGSKIMEYLIKEYDIRYLNVDPKNEIAVNLYKKFGFEKTEKVKMDNGKVIDRMERKVDLKEEALTESMFNQDNLEINFEEWKDGTNGPLYITGLSGGGKTTLTKKLSDELNVPFIELDFITDTIYKGREWSLRKLDKFYRVDTEFNRLIRNFIENMSDEYFGKFERKSEELYQLADKVALDFCKYLEESFNKKYIVEGVHIFHEMGNFFTPDKSYIIIGTGLITANLRAIKRAWGKQLDLKKKIKLTSYRLFDIINPNSPNHKQSVAIDSFKKSLTEEGEFMDELELQENFLILNNFEKFCRSYKKYTEAFPNVGFISLDYLKEQYNKAKKKKQFNTEINITKNIEVISEEELAKDKYLYELRDEEIYPYRFINKKITYNLQKKMFMYESKVNASPDIFLKEISNIARQIKANKTTLLNKLTNYAKNVHNLYAEGKYDLGKAIDINGNVIFGIYYQNTGNSHNGYTHFSEIDKIIGNKQSYDGSDGVSIYRLAENIDLQIFTLDTENDYLENIESVIFGKTKYWYKHYTYMNAEEIRKAVHTSIRESDLREDLLQEKSIHKLLRTNSFKNEFIDYINRGKKNVALVVDVHIGKDVADYERVLDQARSFGEKMLEFCKKNNPDYILVLGDFIDKSWSEKYEELIKTFKSVFTSGHTLSHDHKFLYILGNSEDVFKPNDIIVNSFIEPNETLWAGYKIETEKYLFTHAPFNIDDKINIHGHLHKSKGYWNADPTKCINVNSVKGVGEIVMFDDVLKKGMDKEAVRLEKDPANGNKIMEKLYKMYLKEEGEIMDELELEILQEMFGDDFDDSMLIEFKLPNLVKKAISKLKPKEKPKGESFHDILVKQGVDPDTEEAIMQQVYDGTPMYTWCSDDAPDDDTKKSLKETEMSGSDSLNEKYNYVYVKMKDYTDSYNSDRGYIKGGVIHDIYHPDDIKAMIDSSMKDDFFRRTMLGKTPAYYLEDDLTQSEINRLSGYKIVAYDAGDNYITKKGNVYYWFDHEHLPDKNYKPHVIVLDANIERVLGEDDEILTETKDSFSMKVEDAFGYTSKNNINYGTIYMTGKIKSGMISVGDTVYFNINGKTHSARVDGIERFRKSPINSAKTNDVVALVFKNLDQELINNISALKGSMLTNSQSLTEGQNSEYKKYIKEHISNVQKGYRWLKKHLPELFEDRKFTEKIGDYLTIKRHDRSKYNKKDELNAYQKHFYGKPEEKEANRPNFDHAWNHHQKINKHHWQYWVLVRGDGSHKTLDMPYRYIIEMICDWWSFSWRDNKLTEIFKWWNQNKGGMILSQNTRSTIEMILGKMKKKLQELEKENLKEDFKSFLERPEASEMDTNDNILSESNKVEKLIKISNRAAEEIERKYNNKELNPKQWLDYQYLSSLETCAKTNADILSHEESLSKVKSYEEVKVGDMFKDPLGITVFEKIQPVHIKNFKIDIDFPNPAVNSRGYEGVKDFKNGYIVGVNYSKNRFLLVIDPSRELGRDNFWVARGDAPEKTNSEKKKYINYNIKPAFDLRSMGIEYENKIDKARNSAEAKVDAIYHKASKKLLREDELFDNLLESEFHDDLQAIYGNKFNVQEEGKEDIQDVVDQVKDIVYGFINKQNGERVEDRDWIHNCSNLGDYYDTNFDPETTLKNKLGICLDQSLAIKHLMNKLHPDYKCDIYALTKGRFGHAVPCYCEPEGKWYYFENAWDKERGLHGPFDNEDCLRKYLDMIYHKHHDADNDDPVVVQTYKEFINK